jgi:hypothetical protein
MMTRSMVAAALPEFTAKAESPELLVISVSVTRTETEEDMFTLPVFMMLLK